MNPGKIGIMGAMEEEISSLIDLLTDIQIDQIGGRTYYSGKLNHQDVVVVFSMWGKVAAAITVTTLIESTPPTSSDYLDFEIRVCFGYRAS